MQIHGPSSQDDGRGFRATYNPGSRSGRPFAIVQMGTVQFFADTPGECEAAIRVWEQAKQLLTIGEPESETGQ